MTTAVGIDTGGTFTDFIVLDSTGIRAHKVLSTPDAPERAILQGLRELGLADVLGERDRIVHGSTVATNAALEGRTARTAYLADAGLADVLTLARQNRDDLYDLTPPPAPEPVPHALCVETAARLDAQGSALVALEDAELERLVAAVAALDVVERLQERVLVRREQSVLDRLCGGAPLPVLVAAREVLAEAVEAQLDGLVLAAEGDQVRHPRRGGLHDLHGLHALRSLLASEARLYEKASPCLSSGRVQLL